MQNDRQDGRHRRLIRVGVAVAAILLGSLIGWSMTSTRLQRSGGDYAEAAVSRITDAWADDELLKRASPQFRAGVDPQELKLGFSVLAHRVGLLRSCAAAQGDVSEVEGKPVTASYQVPCQFEKAAATIHITLIRTADGWQILGFAIDSRSSGQGGGLGNGLKPYQPKQTAGSGVGTR